MAESLRADVPEARDVPEGGDDGLSPGADAGPGEERVARLLRALVARCERAALDAPQFPGIVPLVGAEGSVGLSLPARGRAERSPRRGP